MPAILDGDPLLGIQGYEEPQEFYMEAVILYFQEPQKLKEAQPELYAFVAKTIALAEALGKK